MPKKKKTNVPAAPPKMSVEGVLVQDRKHDAELSAHPINLALKQFSSGIHDYIDAISTALPAVAEKQYDGLTKVLKRLEKFSGGEEDGQQLLQAYGPHAAKEMIDAANEAERLAASQSVEVVAQCLFIGYFTLYDAYIGDLLQAIHEKKPELFKSITRVISVSDLLEYGSIDLIKKDMLDKEIDSFRRDSYIEQFAKLESKFELKSLRDFPEWTKFVEMGQRRNLLTHNGGKVSQQYLTNCEKERVPFADQPSIGERLELDPDYLTQSLFVIGKVGFMLGHTLWRKVLPKEAYLANEAFNSTLYDLLTATRWRAASEYGLFGLQPALKHGLTEEQHKIRVVNTAVALKKTGRCDEATGLIASVDWTACLREFSLAKAVLEADYRDAAEWMKKIGKEGEMVNQLQYHLWPLFDDFRGTKEFQDAYRLIYGIDFAEKASKEVKSKTRTMRELGFRSSSTTTRKRAARETGKARTC